MKKIAILTFILLAFPVLASAQTACPIGMINDPAPGSCGSFVDENGNDLCDLSEIPLSGESSINSEIGKTAEYISGEELKQYTVQEVAGLYDIDSAEYANEIGKVIGQKVSLNDSLQVLHDNYGLCSGVAGSIALNLKNQASSQNQEQERQGQTEAGPKGKNLYNFFPLTIGIIILYAFTWLLVKLKKITLALHRRVWNVLLLLTFLISGLLGLLLVIRINYGWSLNLPFNILRAHVEAGIAMAIISFFHIAWHANYYICVFKRANKDKCETNEQEN